MSKEDFASMLEASFANGSSRTTRRLEAGQSVEATVIQIAADSVFVDVGTPGDGRIPRAELVDASGELRVKVGQKLRATVVDPRGESPLLAISIGRGGSVDLAALESALANGTPVEGRVTQAVKSGLEVEIGGVRAFCPASQVDVGYTAELQGFVGRTLEFKVLELRDGGRSVVVSRRARLEDLRRETTRNVLEQLAPGTDLEGTVHAIDRHGVVVDLGGIEGFVHVSELATHRVERPEDVVRPGESVKVRVLSVEESQRGVRVRLSMKARKQGAGAANVVPPDEILAAKVVRIANHGVFVETAQGEGLVHVRDLGLAPGADHRRAFPIGREFVVVLASRDAGSGKLRFSATGVAAVEENRNFREFAQRGGAPADKLGNLGEVLQKKLGLPPPGDPKSARAKEPGPEPRSERQGVVRRRRG